MTLDNYNLAFTRLPGAATAYHANVNAIEWLDACRRAAEGGGRLVALWASERAPGLAVHSALATSGGLALITLTLTRENPEYPGIEAIFPVANRMQRAAFDLLGVT